MKSTGVFIGEDSSRIMSGLFPRVSHLSSFERENNWIQLLDGKSIVVCFMVLWFCRSIKASSFQKLHPRTQGHEAPCTVLVQKWTNLAWEEFLHIRKLKWYLTWNPQTDNWCCLCRGHGHLKTLVFSLLERWEASWHLLSGLSLPTKFSPYFTSLPAKCSSLEEVVAHLIKLELCFLGLF